MKNKICFLTFITVLLFSASGCGGKKVKSNSNEIVGPEAPQGASSGPSALEQLSQSGGNEAVGPQPTNDFIAPKEGVVLVLGPGLARTVSYLGVIRELEAHNIAIRGLVGVEMGALIAGVWASSNSNSLEWELHKFKKETLIDVPFYKIRAHVAEGKKLYQFLEESLKVDQLQKMRVPVIVASLSNGDMLFESNGSAKDILRGAMAIPGILKTYNFEGKDRVSAGMETPFPVTQAKNLGLGNVLCVDVVGRGDNFHPTDTTEEQLSALMKSVSTIGREELKNCDSVIHVFTDGIGYLNFDTKADLIFKGKQAVRQWIARGGK